MLYVIRFFETAHPEWERFVVMWEGGLVCEFTKAKAWPFNATLAHRVCAELNAKYAHLGRFQIEAA